LGDHRRTDDRRRAPRGGRRNADPDGFTPLIFLIDDDLERREACALLLLHHRFAVVPFESAQRAISMVRSLIPEAIVVCPDELDATRAHLPLQASDQPIPIVPLRKRSDGLIAALRVAFTASVS
jgi:FixJ family two-component response regulator